MISRVLNAARATDASSRPSSNDRRDAIRSCRDDRRDGLDTVARSESATAPRCHRCRGSVRGTQGSAARSLQRSPLVLDQRASCARRRRKRRTRSRVWARTTSIVWRGPSLRRGPGCNGRSLMTAGPAVNAPRSVSYFTFGRRKMCEPHLAKMRDEKCVASDGSASPPWSRSACSVGCRTSKLVPIASAEISSASMR